MKAALFYLFSSFWAGAVHAATPGHGKTIAAAYIVGARGKPIDAVILGVFVTLSHTSGIVIVGTLASLGSAWFVPQRTEAYLGLAMGLLVIGLGAWMLWSQRHLLPLALGVRRIALRPQAAPAGMAPASVFAIPEERLTPALDQHDHGHDRSHLHDHTHTHEHSHEHIDGGAHYHSHADHHGHDHVHNHDHGHAHDHGHGGARQHEHFHGEHFHGHDHVHGDEGDHGHVHPAEAGWHSHGWGTYHAHRLDLVTDNRPKLAVLLALSIAGGLLPDPAALAILLAAVSSGRVMLGVATVFVFSVGFASALVVVGVIAAQVGRKIENWLDSVWAIRVQVATSALILVMGVVLTARAAYQLAPASGM